MMPNSFRYTLEYRRSKWPLRLDAPYLFPNNVQAASVAGTHVKRCCRTKPTGSSTRVASGGTSSLSANCPRIVITRLPGPRNSFSMTSQTVQTQGSVGRKPLSDPTSVSGARDSTPSRVRRHHHKAGAPAPERTAVPPDMDFHSERYWIASA